MSSPELIQTKLTNLTNAMTSEVEAKNNRYYYSLYFDERLGWDWVEAQVDKASAEVEVVLEPYKVGPANSFVEVEVRELQRREGIDSNQRGLESFEQ